MNILNSFIVALGFSPLTVGEMVGVIVVLVVVLLAVVVAMMDGEGERK